MSDVPTIRFACRPEVSRAGKDYVIWAALPQPRRANDHPLICASTQTKAKALEEYDVWLNTYLATRQNLRAATDALWGFKFGNAA